MSELASERRHTWPQRFLILFNAGLIVMSLTAATALGYFYVKFGQLPRIALDKGRLTVTQSSSDPQNFLLVGSDSRAFVEGGADVRSFGRASDAGPQRADTIMLVRVDPRAHHAWVVSFPRDLLVPIAPDGHLQRINTAFTDGPNQLIQTIEDDFHIPINHYAQVDFKGFQGLVDAVGGVKVYLPSPVRDHDSATGRNMTGLLILQTGCVLLHGDQALAYVRSRHFQYQENGRWIDQTGDLERNTRQQDFVRRTLRVVLSKGLLSPSRLNRLADVASNNLKLSNSLSLSELVKLGRNFHSLAPDSMTQYALPVSNYSWGGASVLKILDKDQAAADAILSVFRGTPQSTPTPPPLAPSTVNVRVLNGSGRTGQAGEASAALQQAGFSTSTPGTSARTSRTVIRYAAGQEAKAALLARYLGADAALQSWPGLTGIDLVLVTGTDFTGVLAAPRAATPASTTTTTAAPAKAPPAPDC